MKSVILSRYIAEFVFNKRYRFQSTSARFPYSLNSTDKYKESHETHYVSTGHTRTKNGEPYIARRRVQKIYHEHLVSFNWFTLTSFLNPMDSCNTMLDIIPHSVHVPNQAYLLTRRNPGQKERNQKTRARVRFNTQKLRLTPTVLS